jgi:hypothetical protein
MTDFARNLFIDPDELGQRLQTIDSGMVVTHGHYETSSPGSVADLEWNHMDPNHRQYIHNTYGKSLRLCTGADYQVSITKYGNWPLFIPVIDVRIRPGLFYQCISVLGLATVIAVLRTLPAAGRADQRIDWYIVSKRIWRFLHPWLNAKMAKLNRVQNAEDEPVRQRRADLKGLGFKFRSDPPDYLVASSLAWQLIPPAVDGEHVVSLTQTDGGEELRQFTIGNLDFLYRFHEREGAEVWPGACPHEGGPLRDSLIKPTNGCLKCPWHGLEIRSVRLTPERPTGRCQGVALRLEGANLIASRA